jgi:alpha-tubulin suppressor-like RCC1 family protein
MLAACLVEAKAELLINDNDVFGQDWSRGAGAFLTFGFPQPPTAAGVFFVTRDEYADFFPSNGEDIIANRNYTKAATDWISPFYLTREIQGTVNWSGSTGGHSGHVFVRNQGALDLVNEHIDVIDSTDWLIHTDTEFEFEVYTFGQAIGQDPIESINGITAQGHAEGPITKLIEVTPITLVFLNGEAQAFLDPIPGSPPGQKYREVFYPPALAYGRTSVHKAEGGLDTIDDSEFFNTIVGTVNNRNQIGYGPYADRLPSFSIADDKIHRGSVADYLTGSGYNTTGGKQIGELITYSIVPAHPRYETGTDARGFAFQVAMQLGTPVARLPLYADVSSPLNPPDVTSTPAPPSAPSGEGVIPVCGTVSLRGFSLASTLNGTNLAVDLFAQAGTITIRYTNGLTTVTGNGTSTVHLEGAGTNLVLAVNSMLFTASCSPGVEVVILRVGFPGGDSTTRTIPLTVKVPAPSGIVSWWRGESNARDCVGTNHGTLTNNTTYASANVGQGFALDGDHDAVVIGNPASLQLQDFTIEAWVKRNDPAVVSLHTNTCGHLFGYGRDGYAFGMYDDGGLFLTKVGVDNVSVSPGIIDTNSFHHVAVTKSNSTVVFYVDGVAYPTGPYVTHYEFTTGAVMGARGDDRSSSFLGVIDEVALYNRALGTNEVQAIYSAGPAGKCPPAPPVLASGGAFSLAAKADGSVWSWGLNGNGQLGINSTTGRVIPGIVPGITSAVSVAAGSTFSMALQNNGTVWTWGANANGQLGDGTTTQRLTPVPVTTVSNAVSIGAGYFAGYAALSNGTVRAWGQNTYGQLGNGNTTQSATPVQVTGLSNVVKVAGGQYFGLALKSDGTVWGWGINTAGQLGDGTYTSRTTPVRVTNLTQVVDIAGGSYAAYAIKSDGTLWAWGHNGNGQIGDNTSGNLRNIPVQVQGLTNVVKVAGGQIHAIAVKSDGTVWSWGANVYGQLADGTTTAQTHPVPISLPEPTDSIAAGFWCSISAQSDGLRRGWGHNQQGQVGDGSSGNMIRTPVQIEDF